MGRGRGRGRVSGRGRTSTATAAATATTAEVGSCSAAGNSGYATDASTSLNAEHLCCVHEAIAAIDDHPILAGLRDAAPLTIDQGSTLAPFDKSALAVVMKKKTPTTSRTHAVATLLGKTSYGARRPQSPSERIRSTN